MCLTGVLFTRLYDINNIDESCKNNVPRIIVLRKTSSIIILFDVLLSFVKASYVTTLLFHRSKFCKTSINSTRHVPIKVDSQPSTLVVFWLVSLCAHVTFRYESVMRRHEKVTHHRMVVHALQQDPRDAAGLHSTGRCRRQEAGLSTLLVSVEAFQYRARVAEDTR